MAQCDQLARPMVRRRNVDRIVALGAGAKPAKRELRVDGEAGLHLPARLVDPAEMRETGGEQEERQGSVATEFPPFSRVLRLNSPASLSPQNSVSRTSGWSGRSRGERDQVDISLVELAGLSANLPPWGAILRSARREPANPSGGVMAKRGKASGAGEASVPPAPSASERETLDTSVASLSRP